MYDKNIEFEERVTRMVDENEKELARVNELLDLALIKLEMGRKELEAELLKGEEEKRIDKLVEVINNEYEKIPCMDKSCFQCDYGGSKSCETKFVIKRLIEIGMLKL